MAVFELVEAELLGWSRGLFHCPEMGVANGDIVVAAGSGEPLGCCFRAGSRASIREGQVRLSFKKEHVVVRGICCPLDVEFGEIAIPGALDRIDDAIVADPGIVDGIGVSAWLTVVREIVVGTDLLNGGCSLCNGPPFTE